MVVFGILLLTCICGGGSGWLGASKETTEYCRHLVFVAVDRCVNGNNTGDGDWSAARTMELDMDA